MTKSEELKILRNYHAEVMQDKTRRQDLLVNAGIFVRAENGEIKPSDMFKSIFTDKKTRHF